MLKLSKNKGFTIIELIIVVAIIAILMTISAFGVSAYLDNADKLERDNAAKTTYMALQDYLTSIKKTGGLEDFNKSVSSYCSKITDDQIKSILEKHYTENVGAKVSEYFEDHNGTEVVALTFSSGNKAHPLYSILFDCLADADALDKSFVIEYNQTTGSIMSVFYSKTIDGFDRSSLYSSSYNSEYNIVLRDKDSLNKKKQGYYGVYKTALKGGELLADVNNEYHVSLINDDRIYLDIVDTTPYTLDENVSYTVDLYVEGSKTPLDTFVFRRQDITRQVNTNQTTTSLLDIIDHIDGTSGDRAVCRQGITTAEGNTADEYYVLLDCEHHNNVDEKYAEKILELTGKPAEKSKMYASISLVSNGVIADLGTTESINPVFDDYDEARNIFFMSCTRHLNNIRNYGQNNSYALSNDINLKEFEREEDDHTVVEDKSDRHYFEVFDMIKCKNTDGNPVEFLGDFVGVKSVASDKTVDLMDVKSSLSTVKPEDCFTVTAINIIEPKKDEIGLFHNLPTDAIVGGVNFDELCVTGAENVGGVCVKNKGRIEGVFVTNADIKGKKYVGGIISTASGPLTNLRFSGSVEGLKYYDDKASTDKDAKKFLGGIVSESYHNITDCHFEGKVYSDEANVVDQYFGGITGRTWDGASISNCTIKNFELRGEQFVGGIVGYADGPVSDCDISGSYLLDNTHAPVKDYEACLGGVAGATSKRGTVTNCNIRCPEGILKGVFYDKFANDIGSKAMGGLVGRPEGDIDNCYVELKKLDGYRDIGGISGRCYADKVTNCTVKIETIETDGYVGGIIGVMYKNEGIIKNCKTLGVFDDAGNRIGGEILVRNNGNGKGYSGGILGVHSAHLTVGSADSKTIYISDCENNLNVHADMRYNYTLEALGGITSGSKTINLYMDNCINNGDIIVEYDLVSATSGSVKYIGGIAGGSALTTTIPDNTKIDLNDYKNGIVDIKNCKNTGDIIFKNNVAATYVGGIFGSNTKLNKECVIEGCVNEGNIVAENIVAQNVGGIMGGKPSDSKYDLVEETINIIKCENKGSMSRVSQSGGIFGYSDAKLHLNISDCVSGEKKVKPEDADSVKYENANNYVGGFVGQLKHEETDVNITSSVNYADISGNPDVDLSYISGGIAYANGQMIVSQTKNYGNIYLYKKGSYISGISSFSNVRFVATKSANYGSFHTETELYHGAGILSFAQNGYAVISECDNEGNMESVTKTTNSAGIVGGFGKEAKDANGYKIINGYDISITDCKNSGKIVSDGSIGTSAGIIGFVANEVFTLNNCENKGDLVAGTSIGTVGGIIGRWGSNLSDNAKQYLKFTEGNGVLANNINNGNIVARTSVGTTGGIIGHINSNGNMTIDTCINNGKIEATGKIGTTGGVLGKAGAEINDGSNHAYAMFGKNVNIINCNNNGDIKSAVDISNTGGIAGLINGGNSVLRNTNNTGNITAGTTFSNVSGLLGRYGNNFKQNGGNDYLFAGEKITIENCKNASEIYATTSASSVGGAIGYVDVGELVITSVENSGKLATGTSMSAVGGLVGKYGSQYAQPYYGYYIKTTKATIENSSNKATIEAVGNQTNVGGLTGYAYRGEFIARASENSGDIITDKTAVSTGGAIGRSEDNTFLDKCNNSGNIIGKTSLGNDNEGVGGIMGSSYDTKKIVLSECNNTGDMLFGNSASRKIAGILGIKKSELTEGEKRFEITNCKNSGNIRAIDENSVNYANHCAGILGASYMTTNNTLIKITGCENTGSISNAGKYSAGIAGEIQTKYKIKDCKNGNKDKYVSIKGATDNNGSYVGGIIGYSKYGEDCNIYYLDGSASIIGCDSYANISYKNTGTGTIIRYISGGLGYATGGIYLENIKVYGNITAKGNLLESGGIAGFVTRTLYITDSVNNAAMNATGYARSVGGVAGINKYSLTVKNCTNNGSIEALDSMGENNKTENESKGVAGIIGTHASEGNFDIVNCTNTGDLVFGKKDSCNVGGIVGIKTNTLWNIQFENCKNTGDIRPSDVALTNNVNRAGGLIGYYGIMNGSPLAVKKCENTGSIINAADNVGGFIGEIKSQYSIDNSRNGAEDKHIVISGIKKGSDATNVGGLIGFVNNNNGGNAISNTNTYADINYKLDSGKKLTNAGGLAGYIIGNMYNNSNNNIAGNISVNENMENCGGTVGYITGVVQVSNYDGNISAGGNMTYVGRVTGKANDAVNTNSDVVLKGNISAGKDMKYVGGAVGYVQGQFSPNNSFTVEGDIISGGNMESVAGVVAEAKNQVLFNNVLTVNGNIKSEGNMTSVSNIISKAENMILFNNSVDITGNLDAAGDMTKVSGFVSETLGQAQFNNVKIESNINAGGDMTNVAGLISEMSGWTQFNNEVKIESNINAGGNMTNVGGIIAVAANQVRFNNEINASGDLNSKQKMENVGGVVGYTTHDIAFGGAINVETDIISEAGMLNVGGVFGYLKAGSSSNCNINYSGLIKAKEMAENVGGVYGTVEGPINVSGSTINVNIITDGAAQYVGGIVGLAGIIGVDNNAKIMFSQNTVKPFDDKLPLIETKTANCVGSFVGNVVRFKQSDSYISDSNSYGNIVAKEFTREYTCLGGMVGKVFNGGGNFKLERNNYYGDIVIPATPFIDLNGIGVGGLIGTAHTDDSKVIVDCHHRGKISRDKINGDVRIGYLVGHANRVTLKGDINDFADVHWSYNAYGKYANCTLPANEIFDVSASYINNAEGYYEAQVNPANGSSLTKIGIGGTAKFTVDTKSVSENAVGVKVSVKINRISNGKIIGTENLKPDAQGVYTISNIKSYVNIIVTIDMESVDGPRATQNIEKEPDNKLSKQSIELSKMNLYDKVPKEGVSDNNDSIKDSDSDDNKPEFEEQDTKTVSGNALNMSETGDVSQTVSCNSI